ncbi:hypothetical protein [Guptibacillus algicola]|uniref:hypothetical protein n=1 Tax=Guptibacillus algicola TaxID=225844 RepID=UPI001CD34FEA|nr:hypothetical protein [Alkalihalobacillus algicola]MCA0988582.1 hypothetical protein [Alkalihalobacillus algicola]
MKPSFLIGAGIFFFLLVPLGIFTNIFPLYGIGLSGAGLCFVIFSIIVKKDWKGFNRFKRVPYLSAIVIGMYRVFLLGIGLLALYGASAFWQDLPAYMSEDYPTLEGVPEDVMKEEGSDGLIILTMDGKKLPLPPESGTSVEDFKGERVEVSYLENTEWIMDYKVK